MKWTLKIATAGLVVTAATVAAVYVSQHFLVDALDSRIEEKTGLRAHFTKTDLGFWPTLHFTGENLRLTDADPSHEPVLTVDRVNFDIAWNTLFSGNPQIRNAVLTRPRLTVIEGETKTLAPAPENRMSRLVEEAKLDAVTIKDGAFTMVNLARRAKLQGQSIELNIQTTDLGSLDLSGGGRFGAYDARFKLATGAAKDLAAGTPTAFKAEVNVLDVTASPVTLQGKLRLADHTVRFESGPEQLTPPIRQK